MSGDLAPERARGGFDRIFKTALLIVPIGVLGNIAFSLAVTDRQLLEALDEFPRHYLALAVALALLPWVTNTLRLIIWTHVLGFRLRFGEALQMTLAVDLGSAVSPTAVGGGLFKWGMLVQRGVSPGAAASVVTFPSIEDGIFFALALPLAVVYTRAWKLPVFHDLGFTFRSNAIWLFLAAAGIGVLTWAVVRWMLTGGFGSGARARTVRIFGRTRRRLRQTWLDAREVFRIIATRGKWWFLASLGITAVQWAARYSVVSALAAFLGASVDPILFWLLQWVVFTMMSFIPTPGAAGGAEASFFLVYSALLPEAVIGLATAGWRFLTFYLQLGLAAVIFAGINGWKASRERFGRAVV